MSDWRLNGQEEYLFNAVLYKVTFPDFWEKSYGQKNKFYQKIRDYAAEYVEKAHRWKELLEGESVGRFWHEHCEFCWETAYTSKPCAFYCTEDMYYWICETCFRDFYEQFHWQVQPIDELLTELAMNRE